MESRTMIVKRLAWLSSLCATLVWLLACGGGSIDERVTTYFGRVLAPDGRPASGVQISLFETAESATTDDDGNFELESFRRLTAASFYFGSEHFSEKVRIEEIPESAAFVQATFAFDEATLQADLVAVEFDDSRPPTPVPTATAPAVGTAKPTAQSGNFDSNGNTSAFGIPSGLTGNIERGRGVWNRTCLDCHAKEKSNRSYQAIQNSLRTQPQMQQLRLSNQQVADVVAYLNRSRR